MTITVDQLSRLYPRAYHIAEVDALPTIRRHGLLSTTAILDMVGVSSRERLTLEGRIRESCVRLQSKEGEERSHRNLFLAYFELEGELVERQTDAARAPGTLEPSLDSR